MKIQKVKYIVGSWCENDLLQNKVKDGYINTEQILILENIQKLTNYNYTAGEVKEVYYRELILNGNIKMIIIGNTEKEVYINIDEWDY